MGHSFSVSDDDSICSTIAEPICFVFLALYVLTLLVLLRGTVRSDTPAALGLPYFKGKR